MKKSDNDDVLDKNLKRCHSPLCEKDTANFTFGCRHSNPDSCNKCYTACCAFFREDKCCTRPPNTWKERFERLIKQKEA